MSNITKFKEFRNKTLAPMMGGRQGGHVLSDKVCTDIIKTNPLTIGDLYGIKGFPKDGKKFDKMAQAILDWFTTSDEF